MSTTVVTFRPQGAAAELFRARDPELLLSGPAGTGKSRACLEKMHLAACRHAGSRWLMVRKTRVSLTQSGMVTFARKVLHPLDGVAFRAQEQEYRYPNGSVVVVSGLDEPSRIQSAEYDCAYVQEATELEETDWETILSRLRYGAMPYQQVVADCTGTLVGAPGPPLTWVCPFNQSSRFSITNRRAAASKWVVLNPARVRSPSGEIVRCPPDGCSMARSPSGVSRSRPAAGWSSTRWGTTPSGSNPTPFR